MSRPKKTPTWWKRPRVVIPTTLALLTATLSGGCSTVGFYSQAVRGQMEIWQQSEPIATVTAAPEVTPELREKLALARQIVTFAETEMNLDAGGSYEKYADLGRSSVVYNVFAAPEFSTEPKRWRYPLIGRLAYRGYFSEASAQALADKLNKEGLDTFVGGVEAYSTLGWLNDPLLNTFMDRNEEELVTLLCHELTHARFYASGDDEFSEAFAVAVEEEALRRWREKRGEDSGKAKSRRKDILIPFLLKAQERLEACYEATADLPIEQRRAQKEALLGEIHADYQQLGAHSSTLDEWFEEGLNNAHLTTISTYYKLLPAFRDLLAESSGDMEVFYTRAEAWAKERRHKKRDED